MDTGNSIDSLNQAIGSSQTKRTNNKDLGQDAFLKLLVAQMSSQSPLEPQTNGEFISQMAQFGTVDGIKNIQELLAGVLNQSLQSNQALQASALVGRRVLVPMNEAQLTAGKAVDGMVELPGSVADLNIGIYNQQGELVKQINLGTQAGGDVRFSWDGLTSSGEQAPAGKYVIKAEGAFAGKGRQFNTYLSANVDSVTLNRNTGSPTLNVAGVGSVTLDQVKEIS